MIRATFSAAAVVGFAEHRRRLDLRFKSGCYCFDSGFPGKVRVPVCTGFITGLKEFFFRLDRSDVALHVALFLDRANVFFLRVFSLPYRIRRNAIVAIADRFFGSARSCRCTSGTFKYRVIPQYPRIDEEVHHALGRIREMKRRRHSVKMLMDVQRVGVFGRSGDHHPRCHVQN
jgi:hypothetical protein